MTPAHLQFDHTILTFIQQENQFMSTVVNMSDFEGSKENFQPLKQGRSMAKFGAQSKSGTAPATATVTAGVKSSAQPVAAAAAAAPTPAQRERYVRRSLCEEIVHHSMCAVNSKRNSNHMKATTRSTSGFGRLKN
jgi:hypothetical protein